MIDFSAVTAVFSVYIVGVVIPGPNFVAVAHKSVSATRRDAFALVAGIVVVNLFWATCAILGVGVVFAIFPWVAIAVKLAGAGYLIWFGLRLIWFGLRLIRSAGTRPMAAQNVSASSGFGSAFMQGVATNIANPKSIAFYAAVFQRRRLRTYARRPSSRCSRPWAWWRRAGMAASRCFCRMRPFRARIAARRNGSTVHVAR
ncbi:LysE family translocator [Paraburkholderia caribensis]|uniref:LysE family translocator n=1 Tax=Paraburkholderia caribensis TaxID=75105 RepID=UPI001CB109EA|nr:membrane hypothetical protein [Paraburkholderia caribensis]